METIKTSPLIDAEKLARVAEVLKTIAHPVRLVIIENLQNGKELSVTELMEITGVEQSSLSHHLIKMKDKGILSSRRDGKNIYYLLRDEHITQIFGCMEGCKLLLD